MISIGEKITYRRLTTKKLFKAIKVVVVEVKTSLDIFSMPEFILFLNYIMIVLCLEKHLCHFQLKAAILVLRLF